MDLQLLRNKNFFLLVWGGFVSVIGSVMQNFAFSLYVLKITGSGTLFASVLAIGLVPQIIMGPVGGVLADRFDRKKMIVILDFASGAVVGVMALIYYVTGSLSMVHIYISVIALSVISVLFSPAANAMVPTVIEKEKLLEANSLNSFAQSGGQIIAPLVGGLLYGIYGLLPVLICNAVSFIVSAISETFIELPNTQKDEKANLTDFYRDFLEGLKFIKEQKEILHISAAAFILNFACSPIFSLGITYIAKEVLFISDLQYGLLQSISAGATLLGPILIGFFGKKFDTKDVFAYGVIVCGVILGIIAIIITPFMLRQFGTVTVPYILLIVLMFCIIGTVMVVNICIGTLFHKQVPLEMQGRAGGVMGTLAIAAIPAGQMLFGTLFDVTPAFLPTMMGGMIMAVTGVIFQLLTRKSRMETKSSVGIS